MHGSTQLTTHTLIHTVPHKPSNTHIQLLIPNEEGLASTLEAIAKLPPLNKDTLAYLILHLQRVAYYSTANKMPLANLVTVFALL